MIRSYELQDTDAVVDIWRRASELAHPFLTKDFLDTEAEALRTVYLAHAKTWVIEADAHVVGFVSMAGNEVAGLFLDPAYHRRGLGKALVDKVAADHGALTVEVFKQNVIGRDFYDGYGFLPVDEYVHEPSGQATLRMKLTR